VLITKTLYSFFCTEDGNRTRTSLKAHRILSPACLPVPPPRRIGSHLFLKKKAPKSVLAFRAKDESRTRDLNLGKVTLYQLSYFRLLNPHSLVVNVSQR
jgi:hypothetical protein